MTSASRVYSCLTLSFLDLYRRVPTHLHLVIQVYVFSLLILKDVSFTHKPFRMNIPTTTNTRPTRRRIRSHC